MASATKEVKNDKVEFEFTLSDSSVGSKSIAVTSLKHIHNIRPEYLDKAPSISKLHDHLSTIFGSLKQSEGNA